MKIERESLSIEDSFVWGVPIRACQIANNFDKGIGILWDTLLTKKSKKKHVPHLPCQIYVKRKAIGPLANGQNFTWFWLDPLIAMRARWALTPRTPRCAACHMLSACWDIAAAHGGQSALRPAMASVRPRLIFGLQLGVPHPIICWSFQRQLVKKHVANSKHKLIVINYLNIRLDGRDPNMIQNEQFCGVRGSWALTSSATHSHFSQLILPLVVSLTSVSNIHEC